MQALRRQLEGTVETARGDIKAHSRTSPGKSASGVET